MPSQENIEIQQERLERYRRTLYFTPVGTSLNDLDTIKQNTRYVVTFERIKGVIRVSLNGAQIIGPIQNLDGISTYSYLVMTTNRETHNGDVTDNVTGITIIENFTLEEVMNVN